jgi:hypothetical protein
MCKIGCTPVCPSAFCCSSRSRSVGRCNTKLLSLCAVMSEDRYAFKSSFGCKSFTNFKAFEGRLANCWQDEQLYNCVRSVSGLCTRIRTQINCTYIQFYTAVKKWKIYVVKLEQFPSDIEGKVMIIILSLCTVRPSKLINGEYCNFVCRYLVNIVVWACWRQYEGRVITHTKKRFTAVMFWLGFRSAWYLVWILARTQAPLRDILSVSAVCPGRYQDNAVKSATAPSIAFPHNLLFILPFSAVYSEPHIYCFYGNWWIWSLKWGVIHKYMFFNSVCVVKGDPRQVINYSDLSLSLSDEVVVLCLEMCACCCHTTCEGVLADSTCI